MFRHEEEEMKKRLHCSGRFCQCSGGELTGSERDLFRGFGVDVDWWVNANRDR